MTIIQSDEFLTVSGAAREVGGKPADISKLFYLRKLPDEAAQIIGGRRLIPRSFLPEIARTLRRCHMQCNPPQAR